jgi:hypothetical protein
LLTLLAFKAEARAASGCKINSEVENNGKEARKITVALMLPAPAQSAAKAG